MSTRLPHLQTHYSSPVLPHQQTHNPSAPKSTINPDLLPRPTLSFDAYLGENVPGNRKPPHVYSNFTAIETSASSPHFLRLTTSTIAVDDGMQKALTLPIAAVWQPMAEGAERQPSVFNATEGGPFRCKNCGAYANAFFTFTEPKSVICNLCNSVTPYTDTLFISLDGTSDYLVGPEFSSGEPQLNTFVVVVDVGAEAEAKGLRSHVALAVRDVLDAIPCAERSRVALVAFSDKLVCYQRRTGASPQEIVIPDTSDPFCPEAIDALAFRLDTQKEELRELLTSFSLTPRHIQSLEKPASSLSVHAVALFARELLADSGGRVMVFTAGFGHNGKHQSLQASQEKKALIALADSCGTAGMTFDFFVCCGGEYADVTALAGMSEVTGGDVHYFANYSHKSRDSLSCAVRRTMTRNQGFQVLARIRCSEKLDVEDYIGLFSRANPATLRIPCFDADKCFTIVLKHYSKMPSDSAHYLQCALLFTALDGRRILRVCNAVVTASTSVVAVYRSADCETIANVAIKQQLKSSSLDSRKEIIDWLATVLLQYRRMMQNSADQSLLLLPDTLTYLPLYIQSAIKLAIMSPDVRADARAAAVHSFKAIAVVDSFLMLYPRVYRVDDLMVQGQRPGVRNDQGVALPQTVAAAIGKIEDNQAFFIDNGRNIIFYIGVDAHSDFLKAVLFTQAFGVSSYEELVDEIPYGLPVIYTALSDRLHNILAELRRRKPGQPQRLEIVLQSLPWLASSGSEVRELCVEDATSSLPCYGDFLLTLHALMLSKLQ